jgi:MoxR-like ATPase
VVDIERLDAREYRASKDLVYIDTHELPFIYDRLAFRSNLILVGPKGIGKSLSVNWWGGRNDVPVVSYDCSEDVRRGHLLGACTLRGDYSPFVLGPVTTAFEVANEVGRAILLLEEINALTPQMQKVLNAPADFRRCVVLNEAQKVFRLRPGAELWVMGTMNTTVYGGVYQLNEDLKSRFRLVPLGYPSLDKEWEIIRAVVENPPDDDTIKTILTIATETRSGKVLEYALSPRDVVQILEDIPLVGLEKALWIATGKFEDNDRITVEQRIRSAFGISLGSVKEEEEQSAA